MQLCTWYLLWEVLSVQFGLCQGVYNMSIVSIMYLDIFDLWAVALQATRQFEPVITDRTVDRG